MNSAEKLRLLRQRMQEQGMDAYVVVTDAKQESGSLCPGQYSGNRREAQSRPSENV